MITSNIAKHTFMHKYVVINVVDFNFKPIEYANNNFSIIANPPYIVYYNVVLNLVVQEMHIAKENMLILVG